MLIFRRPTLTFRIKKTFVIGKRPTRNMNTIKIMEDIPCTLYSCYSTKV